MWRVRAMQRYAPHLRRRTRARGSWCSNALPSRSAGETVFFTAGATRFDFNNIAQLREVLDVSEEEEKSVDPARRSNSGRGCGVRRAAIGDRGPCRGACMRRLRVKRGNACALSRAELEPGKSAWNADQHNGGWHEDGRGGRCDALRPLVGRMRWAGT